MIGNKKRVRRRLHHPEAMATRLMNFGQIKGLLRHMKEMPKQKEGKMKFKVNDRVMFAHNFAESQCSAFYNNEKIYEIKIMAKCIIPTLSLCVPGERIKVTKYEFE